jgi:hypothetical protein
MSYVFFDWKPPEGWKRLPPMFSRKEDWDMLMELSDMLMGLLAKYPKQQNASKCDFIGKK